MAWDEKNRDEWAKQFLERLGPERQETSLIVSWVGGLCFRAAGLVDASGTRKTFKETQIPLEGTEGATMSPVAAWFLPAAPC